MRTPTNDIGIRPARIDDLEVLERFQQGVVTAERPFDPLLRETGARYYDIAGLLTNPDLRVLLAEHEGTAIACAFARIDTPRPWFRHTREAYLGLMYTEPDWRGRGVNARLIAALKAWCLEQGAQALRLEVYAGNTPAIAAYERAGFETCVLEMRLAIACADTARDGDLHGDGGRS